jgi:hypothetical protein
MSNLFTSALGAIASPIANIFIKKEERKTTKIQAEGKLALAKNNKEKEITLTDQEWESISASQQDTTWKDEYVTIIGTSPYVLIILGAILAAFGKTELLTGTTAAIKQLKDVGVDVGHIVEVVVYAALGLKLWRSK